MFSLWKACLRDHLPDGDFLAHCVECLGNGALSALFPDKCLVCGVYIRGYHDPPGVFHTEEALFKSCLARLVCAECLKQGFTKVEPPFCTRCGTPFLSHACENHLCSNCIQEAHKGRQMLGKIRAFGSYDGLLKKMIHLLKYQKKISLARPLGHLMFHAFNRYFDPGATDLVLPIPLHKKRLKMRGFNQAYLLVRAFTDLWKKTFGTAPVWEISNSLIFRSKNTISQTGFNRKKRKQNIQGAFTIKRMKKIKGKRILLIDDVYTTGATSGEAASMLFKAGARSVDLLVLARA